MNARGLGRATGIVGSERLRLAVDATGGRGPARRAAAVQRRARQIPRIAANILSERLKRLEREGLLIARPYSERPPRAAYQLTAEGTELAGALRLLAHWGARHADPAEAPRHPACGTLLEARWYCPTCDHLVDHEPRDAEVSYL